MSSRLLLYCAALFFQRLWQPSTSSASVTIDPKSDLFAGTAPSKHERKSKLVRLSSNLMLDIEVINGDKISLFKSTGADVGSATNTLPTPIIFIHGWIASRTSWMKVIPEVLASIPENQIVIFPTLRGYGDSQIFPYGESDFTLSEYVSDILKLLTELGFDLKTQKFDWVGHSMGGAVTIHAVTYFVQHVRKMVLMDTCPELSKVIKEMGVKFDEEKNEPSKKQLYDWISAANNEQVAKGWMSQTMSDLMTLNGVKADPAATRKCLEMMETMNLTDKFVASVQKNRLQTLVIFGEEDFVQPKYQLDYAAKIGAQIKRYQDCGHDPHYRYPKRLTNDILTFLREKKAKKEEL